MNLLPALVPLLVFFCLWGIFFKIQGNGRASFLSAAIGWGSLLVALTEVLSLFQAISFWPLLGAWSVCLLAAILGWIRWVGNPISLIRGGQLPRLERFEWILVGGMVFLAAVIGLVAWLAPPNTWDSMTYHMARVMHWIQDRSVAFYPTHIIRQLFMNPGSEFIFLHFQILSNGDRLANFVQWFSMIGSAVGVSLLAGRLGAGPRGQVFAAAISMTIPMGVLQGSSTQNDYTLTFWLIGLAYYLLELNGRESRLPGFLAGASLGLAILTKATAYLFAFPFLIWIGVSLLRKKFSRGILTLGILASLALLINLGQYLRNISLFGSPIGLSEDVFSTGGQTQYFKYSNDVYSLPVLASNVVRNVAVNMGTPIEPLNQLLMRAVVFIHAGLGISPNDARTTWPETDFQIAAPSFYEESTGNPLGILLILLCLILFLVQKPMKRETLGYLLALIAAFLLFSLYLKWQPWGSRLVLPLFVLWSVIVGLTLANLRGKWMANALVVLAFLGAVPGVLLNFDRPLIGSQNIFNTSRAELYFKSNHSLWFTYPRVVQYLGYMQCKQVGLYFDGNTWEYPLWVLLQQELGRGVQIESVNVENPSAQEYNRYPEFTPCAVLVANPLSVKGFQVNHTSYSLSLSTKFISVLMPK